MNEEYLMEELDDLVTLLRRIDSLHISLDDLSNEIDCLHIEHNTARVAIGSVCSMRILLQMTEDLAKREYSAVQQKYETLVNQRKNKEVKK